MSYVDMMGDVRWTDAQHKERIEAIVRSQVTHTRDHVLIRRSISFAFYLLAQMLPAGHPAKAMVGQFGQALTPAALEELQAAAAVFLAADEEAGAARIDADRLHLALDYEEAHRALDALPPAPEEGEDPDADRRAALAAALDAASEDTLALVAMRGRLVANVPEEDESP